jgi:hypothetical protein
MKKNILLPAMALTVPLLVRELQGRIDSPH